MAASTESLQVVHVPRFAASMHWPDVVTLQHPGFAALGATVAVALKYVHAELAPPGLIPTLRVVIGHRNVTSCDI